jgi:hypothetical protein
LVRVELEWRLAGEDFQLRVAHQHSQLSTVQAVAEAVQTLPITLQVEALAAVAAHQAARQMVRLVTLVVILLLKVLLVVVMPHLLVAHTLLARAVAQAQSVKVLLAHQLLVMAVQEQQTLFLVHL